VGTFMGLFIFFGLSHSASAQFADEKIAANFPRGQSVNDAWLMLSQYECPGHCLETPKADLRIFFDEDDLIAAGKNDPNDTLTIKVQTLCRYVGNPSGSSKLDGGEDPNGTPNWPNSLRCTSFNSLSNPISTYSILRKNLVQSKAKYGDKIWFTDLSLKLDQAPGSDQPLLGVYIYNPQNIAYITAQEDQDPTNAYTETNCYTGAGGTCSRGGGPPVGNNNVISFWNNYGSDGPGTTHRWGMTFGPDCSVTSNTQAYLKWYDADDSPGGNGTQAAGLNFDLIEIDENGNRTTLKNNYQADLGGNDSYRRVQFTVKPNHKYVWRWNNVSATNGIQVWLPYSEMNPRIDCNTGTVRARCSVTASNLTPAAGTNITVTLWIKNTGTDPWPDPVTITGSKNHGIGNLQPQDTRTYNDTYTRGSPGEVDYTYNIMNGGTRLATCSVTVEWQAPIQITNANCTNIHINNPTLGGFRLRFIDLSTGAVEATSPPRPQAFSVPIQAAYDYDSFPAFPFMLPYHAHQVQAVSDDLSQVYSARNLVNAATGGSKCMAVSCQGSLNADLEPGKSANVTYGLNMVNYTDRRYVSGGLPPAQVFAIQAAATGGLSGSSPITNIDFNVNSHALTAYNVSFLMTANYTGNVAAHLFMNGALIDPEIPINCSVSYTPKTRPYLQVNFGDVSAGGIFENAVGVCASSKNANFTGPSSSATSNNVGGIRTFENNFAGSGADYAAYALGVIQGDGNPEGFYTSQAAGGPINNLAFANSGIPAGNLGGLMGGLANNNTTSSDAHCATDFFDRTPKTPNPTFVAAPGGDVNPDGLVPGGDVNGVPGQYFYNGTLKLAGTLSAGKSYTIYVNGNVHITNNITYGPWTVSTTTNTAPYLSVIAKGNIYVDSNVTRIDGLYVAQPTSGTTNGAFYTCAIGGVPPTAAQVSTACRTGNLTLNGAVIAQHLYPLRSIDTVNPGAGVGGGPAEIFNFTPAIVIGQPNFKSLDTGSTIDDSIQGLYNLPPVF
jgi:hypothetical protein